MHGKKSVIQWSLLGLFLLPGCGGRLIDYGQDAVPQAHTYEQSLAQARSYVRSKKVYDKFQTEAFFTTLWLSDDVRTTYADLNAEKHGRDQQGKSAFLRRQLAENEHFISFYVLSYVPIKTDNVSLAEKDSPWSMTLLIDGVSHKPATIKIVELPPEYARIFGNEHEVRYREGDGYKLRLRNSYLVKFAAKDPAEKPLIDEQTGELALRFSSVTKYTTATWSLDQFAPRELTPETPQELPADCEPIEPVDAIDVVDPFDEPEVPADCEPIEAEAEDDFFGLPTEQELTA